MTSAEIVIFTSACIIALFLYFYFKKSMKSHNSNVIITWKKHTNKMPIRCQSWHISISKGWSQSYKATTTFTLYANIINKNLNNAKSFVKTTM